MGVRVRVATCFVAVFCTVGVAAANEQSDELLTSGTVAAEAGWTLLQESNEEGEDETDDQSYPNIGGSGSISIPISGAFSTQFDAMADYNFVNADGEDNQKSMWGGGGHLSWRDPQQGLVGIFAGFGRGYTEDTGGQDQTYASWIGLEGQAYLNDATLYLQAARVSGNVRNTEEDFRPAYVLRGVGRYFIDDDKRIELEASYANANNAIDDVDDMWVMGWGVRYDQRISGGWHGYAAYRGGYYDTTTEGEELTEQIFALGVTYLFGAESMKANDRRGATLDQPSLPMRATNWVEPLD